MFTNVIYERIKYNNACIIIFDKLSVYIYRYILYECIIMNGKYELISTVKPFSNESLVKDYEFLFTFQYK